MRAAHQRFSASISAGPRPPSVVGLLAIEQARSRRARPPARCRARRHAADQRAHHRIVFGGRRDADAALEQRQGATPHEVDLEAEQIVFGCVAAASALAAELTSNSRTTNRLTCAAIAISRFESSTGERGGSGARR